MATVVLLAKTLLFTGITVCKVFVSQLGVTLSRCLFLQPWCDFFVTFLKSGFWESAGISPGVVSYKMFRCPEERVSSRRAGFSWPAVPFRAHGKASFPRYPGMNVKFMCTAAGPLLQTQLPCRRRKAVSPPSAELGLLLSDRSGVISRREEPKNIPFSFSGSWKPHSVETCLELGDACLGFRIIGG